MTKENGLLLSRKKKKGKKRPRRTEQWHMIVHINEDSVHWNNGLITYCLHSNPHFASFHFIWKVNEDDVWVDFSILLGLKYSIPFRTLLFAIQLSLLNLPFKYLICAK